MIGRLLFLALLCVGLATAGYAQPLGGQRSFEPAVFTGADLVALLGLPPDSLAAFRYDTTGWTRIPSQVDQREYVDLAWAYDGRDGIRCDTATVDGSYSGDYCFTYPGLVFGTVYMDAGTFTGPDGDPSFDADDELVFMARDAGSRAPVGTPPPEGVYGPSGMEVVVALPLTDGSRPLPWYVYLFHHDGRYTAVDTAYVAYDYHLLRGDDYFAYYDLPGQTRIPQDSTGYALGSNEEDTDVETAHYRLHFSDRWIVDGLELLQGTGINILERYIYRKAPGNCERTEYTASAADGAMIANIAGPVRAIRSVIGFNSGPFRQRDQLFYDQYTRTTDYYRVHLSEGVLDYIDLNTDGFGMTYTSNLSPTPRTVDGISDGGQSGILEWEILQGTQGTLVTTHFLETDIEGLPHTSYYADEQPSSAFQCTGDVNTYGASGIYFNGTIPNTDPARNPTEYKNLTYGRHNLYADPSLSAEAAQAFIDATRTSPLFTRTRLFPVDAPIPPATVAGPFARTGEPGDGAAAGKSEAPVFTLRLEAPRPNPSAGRVVVPYEVPTDGAVTLTVYDALGRRVAEVASGWRPAGRHTAVVEAGDLAPGVYVVQLLVEGGGQRAVRLVRP